MQRAKIYQLRSKALTRLRAASRRVVDVTARVERWKRTASTSKRLEAAEIALEAAHADVDRAVKLIRRIDRSIYGEWAPKVAFTPQTFAILDAASRAANEPRWLS